MIITFHAEEFAGLRVREFVLAKGILQPKKTAYRLGLDYDEIEGGIRLEDLLGQLLADANVGQLANLVIGQWGDSGTTSAAIVEMLVSARDKLSGLTGLFLGDIVGTESEISWIRHDNVSPLWAAFPNLKDLKIRGGDGLRLGKVNHAALRSLVIETGGLRREVVAEVAGASLPALRHLELWLGSENYGGTANAADLQPFLAGDLFPRLKTLALRNFRFADELAKALATAPVLKKIDTLDLSLGTLGDEGADALLKSPGIRRLKKLDVHHHYMSEAVEKAVRSLPIEVDAVDRRVAADDYGDNEQHRYVAVSE